MEGPELGWRRQRRPVAAAARTSRAGPREAVALFRGNPIAEPRTPGSLSALDREVSVAVAVVVVAVVVVGGGDVLRGGSR